MTLVAVDRIARRVVESFELAHSLSEHYGVVILIDNPVAPLVLFQKRWRQPVITKPAAALPIDCLADSTLIGSVYHLPQARNDVRVNVLAQLDHDPASAHLLRNGAGCAGASQRIKHPISSF